MAGVRNRKERKELDKGRSDFLSFLLSFFFSLPRAVMNTALNTLFFFFFFFF